MHDGDDIQHKDALNPAPADPDFIFFDDPQATEHSPDTSTDRRTFEARRTIAAVIDLLTRNATPLRCGQRAFVLAHALRLGTFRTQCDLAKKLRLTPGRVSQILNQVKRDLDL